MESITLLGSHRWWAFFLLGVCGWLVGTAVFGDTTDRITAVDIEQTYINRSVPAPQPGRPVRQTFTPGRDGLTEIETVIVVHDGADDPPGTAVLSLTADDGRILAERSLSPTDTAHNDTVRLSFPPQPTSAGRTYTLTLRGNENNRFAVWGYTLDVMPGGALTGSPSTPVKDMRLTTRYALLWTALPGIVMTQIGRLGGFMAVAALILFAPSAGVWAISGRPRHLDGPAWLGTAVAVGLAGWPLVWLWTTYLGGRWTPTAVTLFVAIPYLAAGIRWAILRPPIPPKRAWVHTAAFGLLLLLVLGVRLAAVRDVAVLPWVDASRHGLITAVTTTQQQMLLDHYRPFLPVERVPYHTGAHVWPAMVALLTDAADERLGVLLLAVVQLLSTLLTAAVYAGGWWLTGRRTVAWTAAFLVGIPFFFPAYYTTWGRLTQLAGLAVLAVAVGLMWRWADRPSSHSKWVPGVVIGGLAGGLFLVHARVFMLFLPLAAVVMALRRPWWLPGAGVVTAGLVGGRAWTVFNEQGGAATIGRQSTIPNYNIFPTGYVETGWEAAFLWAAVGVMVILAVGTAGRAAGFGGDGRVLDGGGLLLGWVGVTAVLVGGEYVAADWPILLPRVNVNSAYISLFVPLAIFLGMGPAVLDDLARRGPPMIATAGYLVAGAAVGALLGFGIPAQIGILNHNTLLVREADAAGWMAVAAHVPADGKVAVNAWKWLGETWAGHDGGAWITPVTGRASTTPPIDHTHDRALITEVQAFNEAAAAVDDWRTPEAAAFLRENGVTHVFIGRRGGFFDPAELTQNPAVRPIFQQDGVFLFAVE